MNLRKTFRRIKWGLGVFDKSRISKNFPTAIIRRYRDVDLEECRDLYHSNDNGRFPENCVHLYEQNLQKRETLSLVVKVDGKVVGSGGISILEYTDDLEVAAISFGFVHVEYQKQGIGTLLLAYRLSLLPLDRPVWGVTMTSAGNGTETFFKNFGFEFAERSEIEPGIELDHYYLRVPASDIKYLRKRFPKSLVDINDDARCSVPFSDMRAEYEKLMAE